MTKRTKGKHSGRTLPKPWMRLRPAQAVPKTPEEREAMLDLLRREGFENAEQILDSMDANEIWMNDRYVVTVRRWPDGGVMHLSIRRVDRKPARDWRDFQRIKNEIAGDEAEALELYPAESRLVDGANQFHLWVFPTGTRIPVGFDEGRQVLDHDVAPEAGGVQRPLDDDACPDDPDGLHHIGCGCIE